MSELRKMIESLYLDAKKGDWGNVMSKWDEFPVLAKRSSRFQKDTSGWTFLHQASYYGMTEAALKLINLGAHAGQMAKDGRTAADIAEQKGHTNLAKILNRVTQGRNSLWFPPEDPDLLPSSDLWEEAIENRAHETILALYGEAVIQIPKGSRFYTDSYKRILIGWHGTYDPPCGMDANSLVRSR